MPFSNIQTSVVAALPCGAMRRSGASERLAAVTARDRIARRGAARVVRRVGAVHKCGCGALRAHGVRRPPSIFEALGSGAHGRSSSGRATRLSRGAFRQGFPGRGGPKARRRRRRRETLRF
ncbi:hypothetical protein [Burkholderia sp. BDU5]|uniref:hypothetical protein n=1 Tax=Burkholderia sp. BDU5 TaxID=1385590 RepID=UPI001E46A204|nr:hypothetical protein [Burkholderia sp. BDU5]